MKICISFLSFGTDIFAGMENSTYNLALGFKAIGTDVLVYSGYLSGSATSVDSIPVYRSQLLPRTLPEGDQTVRKCLIKNGDGIKSEICELVRTEGIDCLIAIDALWGITQYSGAWRNIPCPTILSLHVLNTLDLLRQANEVPYLFRRAVSQVLRSKIQDSMPLRDLIVIPNSIDLSQFRPQSNLGRASRVIFCNSRIDGPKGILYLVRGFARFAKEYPEYELWLCTGEFPFGDRLKALAELENEIGILDVRGRVRFLPNLLWSEVPDMIRQSFAVVLPTLYESFGRAAIETLACGVPLIASRVGNLPNLVGDAAILVEPRSAESIYESLAYLHTTPDRYFRLAQTGPVAAAKYDNRAIARTFVKLIRKKR